MQPTDKLAPYAGVSFDGTMTFQFRPEALQRLGWRITGTGLDGQEGSGRDQFSLPLSPSSKLMLDSQNVPVEGKDSFDAVAQGALLLFSAGPRMVLGNLRLQRNERGGYAILSQVEPAGEPFEVFYVDTVLAGWNEQQTRFWVMGELVVAGLWAREIEVPEAADEVMGTVRVEGPHESLAAPDMSTNICANSLSRGIAGAESTGADVIVGDLQSTLRYTTRVGDITAFAIGTTSCNIGTARVNWYSSTNQHPVIIQNVYRLDDRGFQQIGMSWLKHGFWAVSQSLCSPCNDPTPGQQLGVGCSDPYSAPLNGDQGNMSPRSTLNAYTGVFPYPWSGPGWANSVERRVQIHDADLDPALNAGARYFIEGHYLTADDAAAGNADNNSSYREVTAIFTPPDMYDLVIDGLHNTQRGQPAVRAWQDVQPDVVETDIRVPGEGLFILAGRALELGGGAYRYQYSLQNLNSDRAAWELKVPVPHGSNVQNIRFNDIDHHSGEPFSTTDWTSQIHSNYVAWRGQAYSQNSNANALRFGSVFSFSFECDVSPATTEVSLGLFKPGSPSTLAAASIGPQMQDAIPAVSQWGALVLAILLLSAATMLLTQVARSSNALRTPLPEVEHQE